uniref:Uncharacterized protein n=1 Tax=Oryza nivara TaxID=4536 RepID=A0A0E0HVW0_ORYNI
MAEQSTANMEADMNDKSEARDCVPRLTTPLTVTNPASFTPVNVRTKGSGDWSYVRLSIVQKCVPVP